MAITHPARERQRQRKPAGALDELAQRKLEAFGRIEKDFIASFIFVQDAHGQRRFDAFSVEESVRYLHALYICECKDRLLSVPHTARRYDGERSLELLREWQEGHTAGVVGLIYERLDDQPFAELSRQIEEAARVGDTPDVRRMVSGRAVLLNRLFTLAHALDAIFALEPRKLRSDVRAACKRLGHTPERIESQLAELRSDLSAYAPHPALARRNMIVMNGIGSRMTNADGERPGERTSRVLPGVLPIPPYAEATIPGARTLMSLRWIPRLPAGAPNVAR